MGDTIGQEESIGEAIGGAARGSNALTDLFGNVMTTSIQFIANMTWIEWLGMVMLIVIVFIRAYIKKVMDSQSYSGGVSRRYRY